MTLYHEETGGGRPVLLVHAGICDSRMWDPQWETLPRSHRTVRYDMRGFGRSAIPPESFSHARDLLQLMDELGIRSATLVGVSMGGRVATEVAVAARERVDSLVLVGSAFPGHDWSDEVERHDNEAEAALARGEVDAAVEVNLRLWVDGPSRSPADVDPAVRDLVGRMIRRSFELQLPVADEADHVPLVPDLADRLDEVRAPTLVIVGEHDVEDIHLIADRLASGIPDTRRATIPGAAHLPSLERPAEFDELVLGFLAHGRATPAPTW